MARGRIRTVLLARQTADETTSEAIDVLGIPNLAFYLIGYGTLDSGSITYEESTDDPAVSDTVYGGTWSIIGSAVAANDVTGGKQKATHLTVGAYHRVRARIDTVISGALGSVSVVLVASE
jgi:hypothetical protein